MGDFSQKLDAHRGTMLVSAPLEAISSSRYEARTHADFLTASLFGLRFRAARDAKFRLLRRWDRGIKRLDVACGIIPEQNLYLILTLILGFLWPGRGILSHEENSSCPTW